MKRRLTLSRETLVDLTPADLAVVHGGDAITPGCPTIPLDICLTFLTCNPTCHTE